MIKISCIINKGDQPIILTFKEDVIKAIYHYQSINNTLHTLSRRHLIDSALLITLTDKLKRCEEIFKSNNIGVEKTWTYDFKNILK